MKNKITRFLNKIFFLSLLVTNNNGFALIEPIPSDKPNSLQSNYTKMHYGIFCTFGMTTFRVEKTEDRKDLGDGIEPESQYAPTAINADAWVKTAYNAGANYFCFVTKHIIYHSSVRK